MEQKVEQILIKDFHKLSCHDCTESNQASRVTRMVRVHRSNSGSYTDEKISNHITTSDNSNKTQNCNHQKHVMKSSQAKSLAPDKHKNSPENLSSTNTATALCQEEILRISKLDILESEFLQMVSNKIESFFVKIGTSNQIWTIVVSPQNQESITQRPLVFLHGLCAGSAFWGKMMDPSSKNRVCYFLDLPGFAKSSRPDFSTNIDVNEAALYDFLDQWRSSVNLNEFDIVGHSFGGYISFGFALRFPKYVKSIYLIDPWGIYSPTMAKSRTSISDQDLNLLTKAALLSCKLVSPMSLVRKTGTLGRFLITKIKNQLYSNWNNFVSQSSFFDYLFYLNNTEPSGEKLFRSLQDNMYFALHPMADRAYLLDKDIKVYLYIGELSFVNKVNANLGQQLESVLGNDRVYHEVIKDAGHHLYGYDSFIYSFCKNMNQ